MGDGAAGGAVNKVEIYGVSEWADVQGLVAGMLERAGGGPAEPLARDGDTSTWPLATKYYTAELEVTRFSGLDGPGTDASAVVILWPADDDKARLAAVLQRFEQSRADSRMVIVQIAPQLLADADEWFEVCSEHGFECHSRFELAEASMSWQCCQWPSIKIKKAQVGDGHEEEVEGDKGDGFSDDFSPFVSGGPEQDWCSSSDGDFESIKSCEVDEMVGSLVSGGGLDSLMCQLECLKLEGASMDHRVRRRFAAKVALAVEKVILN